VPEEITEGSITFTFPDGWSASQVDDWSFYRNQFAGHFDGIRHCCKKCRAEVSCRACQAKTALGMKCIDILAINGNIAWLIEVKDYRMHQRIKTINIADEIAIKVRDALAMLLAASKNANDGTEKQVAIETTNSTRLRVVLHLEQRTTTSRLFPRAIDPADVLQRLKQLLKAVDPHPIVCEIANMQNVAWQAV
jgi:Holliday junction resolvase